MIVDIVLDKCFNIPNMDIARLSLPQFVSAVSAIIFLSTYDQYYSTYLFLCCFNIRVLVPSAVIFHSLSKGVVATTWKIPQWIFLLPLTVQAISRILLSFTIIFPENRFLPILTFITYILNAVSVVVMQGYWFICFWRQCRAKSTRTNEEMEELSYMLVYLLCFLGFVGLHSAVANPGGWLNTGLSLLFCYNIIQVLLVVGLSVVPGRLLRNLAEVFCSIRF